MDFHSLKWFNPELTSAPSANWIPRLLKFPSFDWLAGVVVRSQGMCLLPARLSLITVTSWKWLTQLPNQWHWSLSVIDRLRSPEGRKVVGVRVVFLFYFFRFLRGHILVMLWSRVESFITSWKRTAALWFTGSLSTTRFRHMCLVEFKQIVKALYEPVRTGYDMKQTKIVTWSRGKSGGISTVHGYTWDYLCWKNLQLSLKVKPACS